MKAPRGLILALVLLAPTAAAMDLLPSEIRLGATEARILVRSGEGAVRVDSTPSILAAPAAPEGDPGEFAPTPRVLDATATWRGLEGILVVVLRRADPAEVVDVTIQDGTNTGVSLEWPAQTARTPVAPWMAMAAIALAAFGARRASGRR